VAVACRDSRERAQHVLRHRSAVVGEARCAPAEEKLTVERIHMDVVRGRRPARVLHERAPDLHSGTFSFSDDQFWHLAGHG
jgi:hypothetical protein